MSLQEERTSGEREEVGEAGPGVGTDLTLQSGDTGTVTQGVPSYLV